MSNKEYALKLHNSYRQDLKKLIEIKPHIRNLNQVNYAKALKKWLKKYQDIKDIMSTIVIDFNAGVQFIQFIDFDL